MARRPTLIKGVELRGLEAAPAQVRGAVRIVPLVRREPRRDLRLWRRGYDEDLTVVALEGQIERPDLAYISYVPHGLVLSWSDDGSPMASYGARMERMERMERRDGREGKDGKRLALGPVGVRLLHRMAKREEGNRLRFLPLHLAMEGFLGLFFSGPDVAWREYSRYALSHGLGVRSETAVMGRGIRGLEDALRVFEIHDGQVGVLLFVADALASAFVVPTPEDYRALHDSLLEDFYGELLAYYAHDNETVAPMDVAFDAAVDSLAALRAALVEARREWAAFGTGVMAGNLLGRDVDARIVYTAGPFTLQRFITDLRPDEENHIGEAIVRDDGTLEYLKTYRLSAAQTRRAYLLGQLAAHNWNLDATGAALGADRDELIRRMERSGFGYLLAEEVRRAARKRIEAR